MSSSTWIRVTRGVLAATSLWVAVSVQSAQLEPSAAIPTVSTASLGRIGHFYVGGEYAGDAGKEVMHGAMYVEVLVPRRIRHAQPIVFLHGAGQTGVDWLQTPDGKPGWAHFFVQQGYVVYVTDQPGRGRSAYVPDIDGPLTIRTAPQLSQLWTAVDANSPWPQGRLYSQWPGEGPAKGRMHDQIFDSFARTQVQFPANGLDRLTVDAHVALLDKIGTPVILITHSLGGAFGWSIADARPRGVAAIVALEPAGPPLHAVDTAKQSYTDRPNLPWGLTNLPLLYEPAIRDPAELQVALDGRSVASGQVGCYLQTGTPRRLSNLASIPVLLISGQASYHRIFDACTARWLSQAGVPTEYLELESVGLTGNGHEMMLEKNQAEIASHVAGWLAKRLK